MQTIENKNISDRRWLRKFPWVPTALVILAVLWLTLVPHPLGEENPKLFPGADKIVHGMIFGGLTAVVLFDRGRIYGWRKITLPLVGVVSLSVALFGILIEFVQNWMNIGRSLERMDMLADSVGAVIVGMIWLLVKNYLTRGSLEAHPPGSKL